MIFEWNIAVTGLTIHIVGRMWTFGLWIREAVELFQQGLVGHTGRSIVDSGASGNVDYDEFAQEKKQMS